MRLAKKLTLLAFIGVGAGSMLASCGDNAQTCGPGTEPNEDGICLPNGDGPDAEPGDDPDAEPPFDPDADLSATVGGTIAIFDTTLTDPSVAQAGLGQVRGGAIRISFNDLTDGSRGGEVLYSGGAGAPIGSCLVTKYSPENPPYDRLDAGDITVSGSALVKNGGTMTCSLQPDQGNPDPYLCTSHEQGAAVVGAVGIGGAVAYSFISPAVSFGMSTPAALAGAARPGNNVGVFQTAAAHGLTTGQFVAITGFTPASFNTPVSVAFPTGTAPVQVLSATTFAISQPGTTAGEAVVTAGMFSGATNRFTGSNIQINGFTTGPSAPLFNSGTGRFMVLNQLSDNTLLLANSAAIGAGTQSSGAAVAYDIARQNPSVTTGGFIPLHDFLTGAPGTTVSDLRIQKDAEPGVWGAIDVTADVPGEAVAPIAIMSIVRSNDVVTVTTAANHGITANQSVRIAAVVSAAGRPVFDTTAIATGPLTVGAYVLVTAATATTFTFAQNAGIDTFTGVGPAVVATGSNSVLTNAAAFATGLTGATVTIAGATLAANNGTFPITASDANTITYTNAAGATHAFAAGTSYTINESGTGGLIVRTSFALDTPATNPSQRAEVFPTTTAANTADLNYSCDNNTADAADDTCGDEAVSTATATLKAMIISGSATKKSVNGLFPFQMPTEEVGQDEWLEWTCAYLIRKDADMDMDAVQAIIDFKPTRIEQQVLFVSGTLLDDGVNVGGVRVLTGHAIAGHQTFCPNAGTAASPGFGPVCRACSNGIDDDGDMMIDLADGGCTDANDNAE